VSQRLRPLAWTLAVLALVAALAVVGLASTHSSTAGRPAPALPTERLAGPRVPSFAAGGRSKVVVFWASWCGPCAQEAPEIERFSRSTAGKGRIVGVDWSDPLRAEARAFIRHYAWTFPNLRDAEGAVGNSYHLRNVPTTFIVDSHARIRATLPGPQSVRSLRAALASVEHS
jgi:thiol-disulfide isomerase/thioredoxin